MNADTVLTAVVGLCCVLAIGATSTTLDSTVATDPEEVTNFDYSKVPIGSGPAQALDDAIDSGRSDGAESGSASSGGSNDGSGSKSAGSRPAEEGSRTGQASKSGGGQQQNQNGGSGDGQQQSGGSGGDDQRSSGGSDSKQDQSGDGTRLAEPSLLDRLLWLLQDLLDLLLAVLPWAVLAAMLAAAYRYRDRLLVGDPIDADDEDGEAPPRDPSPDNDVASAWFEMVERLGLADRRDLTPRECAAAASDRGVDPDAARSLTALFEEVRYGGARVTDERRRRAEQTLSEVRSQLEGSR
ncbi:MULTISPECIES: DUF4129 domain-containing protein [Halorussus]|uniref:DUF4129 domain-containing protein n=1 Tax=Halorussus TaxID=1070314 RepID=UPI000E215920|nr:MULTISPECIES: DUF4129 domain-containing protein [Halorussus]NHN58443.1 DUF4129 domain-containing protein [Halorussus sp. JP-T4]